MCKHGLTGMLSSCLADRQKVWSLVFLNVKVIDCVLRCLPYDGVGRLLDRLLSENEYRLARLPDTKLLRADCCSKSSSAATERRSTSSPSLVWTLAIVRLVHDPGGGGC